MATTNFTSQTKIHQYQPPHQMNPMISKLDRMLDMIESRMDAIDRRIDNLRPPTQPEPKPPYVSRRLDPPDRRPRTGYPPIRYRDRTQDARARPRSGYAERSHLFDRGDQRIQLGFDRHPIRATQPHHPTCWGPPTQQQDCGFPTFDHRPRRTETCWDRPHHQEEVRAPRGQSACHQPRHTVDQPPRLILQPRDLYGQPERVTNQTPYPPPRSPTCWDFDDYEESASHSDGYDDFDVGYSRQPYHQRHSMMPQRPPYFTPDSCCHPTTHLRQAAACLEQPAAQQQPLLQLPPSCRHPPSETLDEEPCFMDDKIDDLCDNEKGVGLGSITAAGTLPAPPHAAESQCFSHLHLHQNPHISSPLAVAAILLPQATISPPCSPDVINIVGQHRGKSPTPKGEIKSVLSNKWIMGRTASGNQPMITGSGCLTDTNMEQEKLTTTDSSIGFSYVMAETRDPFANKYAYIGHEIVGYWGAKQQSRAFDPGGVASPKHIFVKIVIVSWFPP